MRVLNHLLLQVPYVSTSVGALQLSVVGINVDSVIVAR